MDTSFNLKEQPRTYIYLAAIEGGIERPFLGYGLENFGEVYDRYVRPESLHDPLYTYAELWVDRAHNTYLEMWVSGGIVAMLLYVLLLGAALWSVRNIESVLERSALYGVVFAHGVFVATSFDTTMSLLLFVVVLAYINTQSNSHAVFEVDIKPNIAPLFRGSVGVLGVILVLCAFGRAQDAYAVRAILNAHEAGTPERFAALVSAIPDSMFARANIQESVVSAGTEALTKDASNTRNLPYLSDLEEEFESEKFTHSKALYLYARLLRLAGKPEHAVKVLDSAIERAPNRQPFLLEQGRSYRDMASYDDALQVTERAYTLEPTYEASLLEYATALARVGRRAESDALLMERYGTTTVPHGPLLQAQSGR
jgi:tetratricopeptide (TPR) repeat protein